MTSSATASLSTVPAEAFDPTLCFLVREGQKPAAAEICSRRFGMGWIGSLGVGYPGGTAAWAVRSSCMPS